MLPLSQQFVLLQSAKPKRKAHVALPEDSESVGVSYDCAHWLHSGDGFDTKDVTPIRCTSGSL